MTIAMNDHRYESPISYAIGYRGRVSLIDR
jgi:hypothetical protein